jgi:hypothetical protein
MNFESERPKRRTLKIRYLTACADRKLRGGVPGAHANRGIHQVAVKNAVKALETKFACSKIVIGE